MPLLVALVSYIFPFWHHRCPLLKEAETCLWRRIGLELSSWLYLAVSAVGQVDKQIILSSFSYEFLFSFFKGNSGKIF